ncbi:MAG: hypothetical protein V4692_10840, partial [Bdellovibrionota bacterium]
DHPWFVAVQFHPEFKSRPLSPHPLFKSFVEAAANQRKSARSSAAKKSRTAKVKGAMPANKNPKNTRKMKRASMM